MNSMTPLAQNDLAEKVEALSSIEFYGEHATRIDRIETHMSWIFLTEQFAYKLKKPVCWPQLDFTALSARERYCREELRLNRRLAAAVYLDVIPLRRGVDGCLQLDGANGEIVDYVIKMVRLPAEKMLDRRLRTAMLEPGDIRALMQKLTGFYRQAVKIDISSGSYLDRLVESINRNYKNLVALRYGLPCERVGDIANALLDYVNTAEEIRARAGHVVDAHGDLRPEHVYLGRPVQIIDCLEFESTLRELDPVDELAFVALECDRLGAPHVGRAILRMYRVLSGDTFSGELIAFYRTHRALTRAVLAIWHLDDPAVRDRQRWHDRALAYIALAERAGRQMRPRRA